LGEAGGTVARTAAHVADITVNPLSDVAVQHVFEKVHQRNARPITKRMSQLGQEIQELYTVHLLNTIRSSPNIRLDMILAPRHLDAAFEQFRKTDANKAAFETFDAKKAEALKLLELAQAHVKAKTASPSLINESVRLMQSLMAADQSSGTQFVLQDLALSRPEGEESGSAAQETSGSEIQEASGSLIQAAGLSTPGIHQLVEKALGQVGTTLVHAESQETDVAVDAFTDVAEGVATSDFLKQLASLRQAFNTDINRAIGTVKALLANPVFQNTEGGFSTAISLYSIIRQWQEFPTQDPAERIQTVANSFTDGLNAARYVMQLLGDTNGPNAGLYAMLGQAGTVTGLICALAEGAEGFKQYHDHHYWTATNDMVGAATGILSTLVVFAPAAGVPDYVPMALGLGAAVSSGVQWGVQHWKLIETIRGIVENALLHALKELGLDTDSQEVRDQARSAAKALIVVSVLGSSKMSPFAEGVVRAILGEETATNEEIQAMTQGLFLHLAQLDEKSLKAIHKLLQRTAPSKAKPGLHVGPIPVGRYGAGVARQRFMEILGDNAPTTASLKKEAECGESSSG
jgi:hypothetical protein